MGSISAALDHKKRLLAIEKSRSKPDPRIIRRLEKSIERHLKEMKSICKGKRKRALGNIRRMKKRKQKTKHQLKGVSR